MGKGTWDMLGLAIRHIKPEEAAVDVFLLMGYIVIEPCMQSKRDFAKTSYTCSSILHPSSDFNLYCGVISFVLQNDGNVTPMSKKNMSQHFSRLQDRWSATISINPHHPDSKDHTHRHHKLATAFHTFFRHVFFGFGVSSSNDWPYLSENTFTDDQLSNPNFGSFCDIMQFTIAHLVSEGSGRKKNHSWMGTH